MVLFHKLFKSNYWLQKVTWCLELFKKTLLWNAILDLTILWKPLHACRSGLWTKWGKKEKKKTHPLCPYLVWLTLNANASSRTYFSKQSLTPSTRQWRTILTSAGKNVARHFLLFYIGTRFLQKRVNKYYFNGSIYFYLFYFWWIQKIPLWPDKHHTYSIKS